MNNASAGPWWFTAVVAGITGLVALTSAGLTTWLSNKHANKRLSIELDHRVELENTKLLFAERVKLYGEMTSAYSAITIGFHSISGRKISEETANEVEKLTNMVAKLYDLGMYSTSLSSRQTVLLANQLGRQVANALQGLTNVQEGSEEIEFDCDETIDLIGKIYMKLMKEMRKELGVSDDLAK
jgi:hypothetical protein